MSFVEGEPLMYKGIGENQWYHGTYVRCPVSYYDHRHVLIGKDGYPIHRETKNIKPIEVNNNKQAKKFLEVDY